MGNNELLPRKNHHRIAKQKSGIEDSPSARPLKNHLRPDDLASVPYHRYIKNLNEAREKERKIEENKKSNGNTSGQTES